MAIERVSTCRLMVIERFSVLVLWVMVIERFSPYHNHVGLIHEAVVSSNCTITMCWAGLSMKR